MKKVFGVALVALFLAACGGGSDGGGVSTPTAKPLTISMYGKPLVSANATTAKVASIARAASSSDGSTSDVDTTVQSIEAALAARGVTANVSAQVMDGTTLHQIVVGENNGLPPTDDQFKKDPSEWMIVNFQLDDMVTPASDPAQQAAMDQFAQDLTVFSKRAAVAGKAVFAVVPIQTCDSAYSAAVGLDVAFSRAQNAGAPIQQIGVIPLTISFDTNGDAVPSPDLAHLGADCRTPDAYLLNLRVQAIADTIAAAYKEAATPASASSGASATGT
jgi:hypothetical protein